MAQGVAKGSAVGKVTGAVIKKDTKSDDSKMMEKGKKAKK